MAWHLTAAQRSANAKKSAATRKARGEGGWGHKSKTKSGKTTTAATRVSNAKMNAVARLQKYIQK